VVAAVVVAAEALMVQVMNDRILSLLLKLLRKPYLPERKVYFTPPSLREQVEKALIHGT